MLKLQLSVLLTFAGIFCIAQDSTSQLKCGTPSEPIIDSSCRTAFQQLEKYVDQGRISRDEPGFQVSCSACKLTLGTVNRGNLTVDHKSVELALNKILMTCPSKGSAVVIKDGSTNKNKNTNTSAILTISYPTFKASGCSII
ncbi:secreted protein [Melampsora americana]|nr:secreted protein [Melampsora americana]